MDKTKSLLYLSNILSSYIFMCKKDSPIGSDVKFLNSYIDDFKDGNFTHVGLFINRIVGLCNKNHDSLFDKRIIENIKELNKSKDFSLFLFDIEKNFKSNLTFASIPLIEIPNAEYTRHTNDVLIHQDYLKQFSLIKIQEIQSDSVLFKDFYIDRLSSFNQAIQYFNDELGIEAFKDTPPIIMLSYGSKKDIEYIGVMRKSAKCISPLIEITLQDEGLGTISHELFHLLEYEYTKLKYKNHQDYLISSIYYNQSFDEKDKLESNDVFLVKLRTFDYLDSNKYLPVYLQDKLTILTEFFKEHLEGTGIKVEKYDISNKKQCNELINLFIDKAIPDFRSKPNKVINFHNDITEYLSKSNTKSFFHIESLLYDNIYSDRYSEKLARLSGMKLDKDYAVKPLPRGKEKRYILKN